MSGIAGIIRLDDKPIGESLVARMTASMSYRGPDGIAHWHDDGVELGHCLMRTTPESADEQQPYVDPDTGVVIVFAGRLDGRPALLAEIAAHAAVPVARFDAALVVRAYCALGPKFLDHVDGDFAFCIWDPRTGKFVLARDRLGLTPLHYWNDDCQLVFASDLHAIFDLKVTPRQLNQGAVAEILSDRWMLGDETLWIGIRTLRPGTFLHNNGPTRLTLKRYWPNRDLLGPPPADDAAFAVAYKNALEAAVSDTCRSSTPITFSVSGGLDSSALLCLAEKMRGDGVLLCPPTLPCTLDYSNTRDVGEVDFARSACRAANRPLAEFQAKQPEGLELWLRGHCAKYRVLPGYLSAQVHQVLMRYARSQGSRVLVTGEGGDQLAGGRNSDQYEAIRRGDWSGYFHALASSIAQGRGDALFGAASVIAQNTLPAALHNRIASLVQRLTGRTSSVDLAYWLSQEAVDALRLRAEASFDEDPELTGSDYRWWPSRGDFLCQVLSMFELVAAVHQVEVRHPFLTRRLVELSAVMPRRLKADKQREKVLHRRVMRGILPADILARPEKSTADYLVDQSLADLLHAFSPSAQLPLDPSGYEKLLHGFLRDRQASVASAGYDNWTLTSVWLLSQLAALGTE